MALSPEPWSRPTAVQAPCLWVSLQPKQPGPSPPALPRSHWTLPRPSWHGLLSSRRALPASVPGLGHPALGPASSLLSAESSVLPPTSFLSLVPLSTKGSLALPRLPSPAWSRPLTASQRPGLARLSPLTLCPLLATRQAGSPASSSDWAPCSLLPWAHCPCLPTCCGGSARLLLVPTSLQNRLHAPAPRTVTPVVPSGGHPRPFHPVSLPPWH